jgi:enterochelin esterase-like enzyme
MTGQATAAAEAGRAGRVGGQLRLGNDGNTACHQLFPAPSGSRIITLVIRFFALIMVLAQASLAQEPTVTRGRLEFLTDLPARAIPARTVTIWLPDSYRADGQDRYAVVYMHDGQMLFDPALTWNHKAWQVDDVLARLIDQGKVRPAIVVAIANGGERRSQEYTPTPAVARLPDDLRSEVEHNLGGVPAADDYLRFIVETLKPEIDRRYRTRPGPEDTAIMGSSMGGLISLYAVIKYPQIFGAAACLSTHWPVSTNWDWSKQHKGAENPMAEALQRYLATAQWPDPAHHRLYFDHGDKGLDAEYAPLQAKIDQIAAKSGYGTANNYRSLTFPGDDHDENSWHRRLDIPLSFLLPPLVGQ